MPNATKVLVTGISGRIGSLICEHLGDRYELSGIDQQPQDEVPCIQADIADLDAILPAFENIDTVLHLAANPSPRAPWESVLQDNIIGTRNVFEAARLAGVRRVVYASSHHASSFQVLKETPYREVFDGQVSDTRGSFKRLAPDMSRPTSYYGVSKTFGESLGSYFHDQYGLSVICLRIGWVMQPDDPAFSAPSLSLWLSHRDAMQLVQKSIDAAPDVGFAVVNAESDNTLGVYSLESARQLLGYEPMDDAGNQWTPTPNSPSVV